MIEAIDIYLNYSTSVHIYSYVVAQRQLQQCVSANTSDIYLVGFLLVCKVNHGTMKLNLLVHQLPLYLGSPRRPPIFGLPTLYLCTPYTTTYTCTYTCSKNCIVLDYSIALFTEYLRTIAPARATGSGAANY